MRIENNIRNGYLLLGIACLIPATADTVAAAYPGLRGIGSIVTTIATTATVWILGILLYLRGNRYFFDGDDRDA